MKQSGGQAGLDFNSPVIHGIRHRVEPNAISILVADDDLLFMDSIAALISHWDEFRLVAKATRVDEMMRLVRSFEPRIVLMGVGVRGADPLSAIRDIREACPNTRVMVVVSRDDKNSLFSALDAGASAVGVREEMSADALRGQIWGMVGGCVIFSDSLLTRLVAERAALAGRPTKAARAEIEALSPRELEVLSLMMEGLSNAEIGQRLFLSEPTVKKNASRIMDKLHVENRVQAAVLAARSGVC